MNPFTRYLFGSRTNQSLAEFIANWDELEGLVIRVYKGNEATAGDLAALTRLRVELLVQYPRWQAALAPLWAEALVGGARPASDPFAELLEVKTAADYVGNWAAMQRLPAAREALNRLIRSLE